ncbi:phospholipid carrier-dependent glycosyltransferase [Lutibacter sp. A80]|uniref:ArnT family glycosyltransferase n=1 Tax=Lutibacter sp. A80 TaxID=2918453 RepID=UPI001F054305|nr:glycosyltransferase family 39 protein [Lutibacter sp. A80]UMB60958.1 phospholipid carrier-dependent glycosyltransferase [Lutibacter sp. A80]
MIKTLEKYPIITLSILIVLMLLVHLDVPNVTIMEARNFITAREIIQDNNWLLTTMNGEARYQKPPLPTWITAISALTFGAQSLFALRLPAALMVLFLGVFAYYFSLKLELSKKHSLNNSLILITSFYVFGIINEAPWDIFAHGFMFAGLYYLFLFFEAKQTHWKKIILAALFIGLSIMSKGPVSLFAVFLPFLISYGIVFKFKNFKQKLVPFIVSIILFLIIGSWWYIYVRIADTQAFLEIATKETGNWSSYNVKPFYYYWSFFTQSGLWTIPAFIGLLYPYLIKRITYKKVYKFTFWWTLIAVILLSLIPEKKARYLMPVLIPLALNTGCYIQYLIQNFSKSTSKKETIPVYFNFGLIAIIAIILPIGLYIILKNDLSNYIINYILTAIASLTIGSLLLINLIRKNIKNVFYLTVLFMVAIFLFGLPISKILNKNDNFNAINTLHSIEHQEQINTYSIGEITPELLWNYNGILKDIYKNEHLEIPSESKFGILIMNDDVEKITTQLSKNYNLKLTETYNLNVGSKNKKRLIRQFYLVSKK